MEPIVPIQIRGKKIDCDELRWIRQSIQQYFETSRTQISRVICERLGWAQPNGKPQDVACREILRRLEGDGAGAAACASARWE